MLISDASELADSRGSGPGSHAWSRDCPWTPPGGESPIRPLCPFHPIHVRLTSQSNILIDENGTPHLAGLGNSYILPMSSARSGEGAGEDTDQVSHRGAELAIQESTPSATSSTHPTKADDIAAFGFMAFEV